MNQSRRKQIQSASALLKRALVILSVVLDNEQEALDNYPESLQETDRYIDGEEAAEMLEYAINSVTEAVEYAERASMK